MSSRCSFAPTGPSSLFANEIAGKQKDGIIPAEAAKPLQVPELAGPGTLTSAIPIARPDNLDAVSYTHLTLPTNREV